MAAMKGDRGKSGLGIMIGFDKPSGAGPKAPRSPEMPEEPAEKKAAPMMGGMECPNCGCKLELKPVEEQYEEDQEVGEGA
jgi:hypothetical protein